jgi:hypothetical protein
MRRDTATLLAFLVLLALGTAARAQQLPTLRVDGQPEMVIAAEAMQCAGKGGGIDVPDMPPTAFKRADGVVMLLAGNRFNYPNTGSSLEDVKRRDCGSLLVSTRSAEPSAFADSEWLVALYSENGSDVIGLVHNEYHGEEHGLPQCVITSQRDRECWYASTTLVLSRDGGKTFTRPSAPHNVVAALPYKFSPTMKRAGTSNAKVVGNPYDGQMYVLVTNIERNRPGRAGECLLRANPGKPMSWHAWDGQGFTRPLASPYATQRSGDCVRVIQGPVTSLRYLPRFKSFVALQLTGNKLEYRFSNDLLKWSAPRELEFQFTSLGSYKPGDPEPLEYFSLLDPASASRNFDTLESRPYLYFVRWRTNAKGLVNSRRDVMRVRLAIE